LNIPLKTEEDTEAAAKFFNNTIQNRNSAENDADYEHSQAGDYLTQQRRNSKNSVTTTKMIASKHSCKDLQGHNLLIIPFGR
jgi:hypothetical protein